MTLPSFLIDTPIAFAGSPLDRADHIRNDEAAIARLTTGDARLLSMNGLDPIIAEDGGLVWRPAGDAAPGAELVFLGLDGNVGCFAEVPVPDPGASLHAGPQSWNAMTVLEAGDLATYGGARALVGWHSRHRFCPVCGSSTHIAKGGWQRTCGSCGADHFPRTDPVTIMTVEHEGRLLLGRQPRFPAGRYSALAGFVEPGETIEEAVAREIFEEAGVRVRDVSYVASQPWPFPSSLMIGCHAHADDPAITIDVTELEDARWFTREECADALAAVERGAMGRAFGAPPRYAIAHLLLRRWVEG